MKEPYSLEIERQCLASVIQFPSTIIDLLAVFKDEELFYSHAHSVIWSSIVSLYKSGQPISIVLLIDKLKSAGITSQDGVDIATYINALFKIETVIQSQIKSYFQRLYNYSLARKVFKRADEVKKEIAANISEPPSSLISIAQKGLSDCISQHIVKDYAPRDIHGEAREYIESLGNEPSEDGIVPPFPTFYSYYGGFTKGDLVTFAAPPGGGKSTLLNYLAINSCINPENKAKALILDTELETERAIRRLVSSLSGVNEFYIRTGQFRLNPEMTERVRKALDLIDQRKGIVKHLYVANKPIDEIVSIIRRWRELDTNKDDNVIIVYDYLKLTGEQPKDSWKEYQIMGSKTDTLKHLMSEIGASGLAAVQTNASMDVAMANQIKWFTSQLFLVRPKTIDEINEHGPDFGTHMLIPWKTRNQGADAAGFNDLIAVPSANGTTTYEKNFINLDYKNFHIKEIGTYKDILSRRGQTLEAVEEEDSSDGIL